MPAKNSIKISIENGYYHIYNRGANKQIIYESDQDYCVFLSYLKEALSPAKEGQAIDTFKVDIKGFVFLKPKRKPKNFCNKIDLIAYALMPNHFHLLIRQNIQGAMQAFMRSIATRYSMYFNKVHNRNGTIFQGIYKAKSIEDENYLLHLSRYIHLNPKENFVNLTDAYSSYTDYLGIKHTNWLNPQPVISYFNQPTNPNFKKINTYKKFVEEYKPNENDIEILEEITLE